MRATIELYDSVKAGNGSISWRNNATLYTPRGGAPSAEKAIEALIVEAIQAAKESGVRYWYNSLRIAQWLIVLPDKKQSSLRLFPTVRPVFTSTFLWRIFLPKEEAYELVGYKVEYKQQVLHRLSPLTPEEPKPAAEQAA